MNHPLALIHPEVYPSGRKNNGRIALVRTDQGSWNEKLYRRTAFLNACEQLPDRLPDAYFSLNEFGRHRRTESLINLNTLFVDIDLHGLFTQPDFLLNELQKLSGVVFPQPSMICHSGRGLWLLWLIKPLPIHALDFWARCQAYLISQLAHLGADPKVKDVTRVMRLPNTVNSKSSQLTHFSIQNPEPISINDFRHYLPLIANKQLKLPKPARQKTTTHPKLFSPYSLAWAIIDDLEKLAEMRERKMVGHREMFLFIWRNCLAQLNYDPAVSAQILKTKALLYLGTAPLSDKEWLRSTLSPYRVEFDNHDGSHTTGYKLTHEWILNALQITPEEQKEMKTLIDTQEKYRRKNEARRPKRAEQTRAEYLNEKEQKYQSIRELKKVFPNATAQQLADMAKVSRRTVYRAFET